MTRIYTFESDDGHSVDSIRRKIYDAIFKVDENYKREDILITTPRKDLFRLIIFNSRIIFKPSITMGKLVRHSPCSYMMTVENDYGLKNKFAQYIILEEDINEHGKMSYYSDGKSCFSFTIIEGSKYRFDFEFELMKG